MADAAMQDQVPGEDGDHPWARDRRLIRAALEGDQAAFFALYEGCHAQVLATVRQWEKDPDAGDDLVQTTFIKAFRSLGRFRGESSFGTWITRIAINTCLSARRAERSRTTWMSIVEDLENAKAALAAAQAAPDAKVEDRERREMIAERMTRLPDRYRDALWLHYIAGRSYDELTRELEVPMGTLKTWMNRARRHLAFEMARG